MSSKSFIEHLQTSGTDFHNSGYYTESDFMAEKQMEMDILGLTDESGSDSSNSQNSSGYINENNLDPDLDPSPDETTNEMDKIFYQ